MATVHGVVQKETDGTPLLGPGQLLSKAALRELTKQLGARVVRQNSCARRSRGNRTVDARGSGPMFFRVGSKLVDISGKLFPHPALLFVVCSGGYFVRALHENRRPDLDTRLAAARFWNTDHNGAVCAGTMRSPKSLTVASIPAWQQGFFQSEFTHQAVRDD